MIMKDAQVGGAWAWHQDYGYWYQNGVLFPDLVSVFIAVDPCTQGERLPAGDPGLAPAAAAIDHVLTGDQAGADRERVEEIAQAASRSCTSRWSPATPCSSTPTCCTASDQNTQRPPAVGA